jgi:hypothetical protein
MQRPNAELGTMLSGKFFGLLNIAMEGLVSVEPDFMAKGPDESNYTTVPASAIVGGGRMDVLSLEVRRLVVCP